MTGDSRAGFSLGWPQAIAAGDAKRSRYAMPTRNGSNHVRGEQFRSRNRHRGTHTADLVRRPAGPQAATAQVGA